MGMRGGRIDGWRLGGQFDGAFWGVLHMGGVLEREVVYGTGAYVRTTTILQQSLHATTIQCNILIRLAALPNYLPGLLMLRGHT